MKNPVLFKSTYSKFLGVLVVLGSTVLPLSSAEGAPTLSLHDRNPIGDTPTEYGHPSSADQGMEQRRSRGARGPVRSDDVKDTGRSTATQASPEERSRIEGARNSANKRWKGNQPINQPTDYNWFKSP